jgi:hypothetical protein
MADGAKYFAQFVARRTHVSRIMARNDEFAC